MVDFILSFPAWLVMLIPITLTGVVVYLNDPFRGGIGIRPESFEALPEIMIKKNI